MTTDRRIHSSSPAHSIQIGSITSLNPWEHEIPTGPSKHSPHTTTNHPQKPHWTPHNKYHNLTCLGPQGVDDRAKAMTSEAGNNLGNGLKSPDFHLTLPPRHTNRSQNAPNSRVSHPCEIPRVSPGGTSPNAALETTLL